MSMILLSRPNSVPKNNEKIEKKTSFMDHKQFTSVLLHFTKHVSISFEQILNPGHWVHLILPQKFCMCLGVKAIPQYWSIIWLGGG